MIHSQGEAEIEHEATVSAPAEAAPQEQTLYDFVVTLLNDATARAAFAQDPTQVLGNAGLGDITAEDVQDVIPLVMDSGLPAVGVPGGPVSGAVDGLNGLGGLDGAIEQLRGVAEVASERALDGELPAADLPVADVPSVPGVDLPGVPAGGVVGGVEGGIDQLSGVAEAVTEHAHLGGTSNLDSGLGGIAGGGAATLDNATGVLRYDTEAASGEATGQLSENGLSLGSYTDSLVGQASAAGGAGLESSGGMAGLDSAVGKAGSMVDVGRDGVFGASSVDAEQLDASVFGDADGESAEGGVGARTDVASGEGTARVTDDGYAAGGSMETPFGSFGIETTGDLNVSVPEVDTRGDLVENLDADALTRGSEAAASTVATYVTSGGAALHGAARSTAEELPVDLPADVPANVPAGLPMDAPAGLADAPAVDEEVLSAPRNLDVDVDEPLQVADVGTDLPNVVDTVQGVAGELHEVRDSLSSLPNELGVDVPTTPAGVPDLPVANPMPTSTEDAAQPLNDGAASVADTVSDSPLGGIAEKGEDLLPGTSGISDLDLGH